MTQATVAISLPLNKKSRSTTPRALILPLIAFQTAICFVPQLYFYIISLATGTGPGTYDLTDPTLDNFREFTANPIYIRTVIFTLGYAFSVVVIVGVLAFPLAYVISRS